MCEVATNPRNRPFRRRCQIGVALSLSLYIVFSQMSLRTHGSPVGLVLAGLSGAFFFAELTLVATLVVRMRDEFQRILLTRAFLSATWITMGFVTCGGLWNCTRTAPCRECRR